MSFAIRAPALKDQAPSFTSLKSQPFKIKGETKNEEGNYSYCNAIVGDFLTDSQTLSDKTRNLRRSDDFLHTLLCDKDKIRTLFKEIGTLRTAIGAYSNTINGDCLSAVSLIGPMRGLTLSGARGLAATQRRNADELYELLDSLLKNPDLCKQDGFRELVKKAAKKIEQTANRSTQQRSNPFPGIPDQVPRRVIVK